MAKSTKVVIGGREYSLVGDDEDMIRSTAQQVNSQIEFLERQNKELPPATINILAALNIAEENLKLSKNNLAVQEYFITELKEMSKFLDKALQS